MNLVGKIFTVLILVMSLVFATFALAVYSTHKNWKSVVDNPPGAKNSQDLGLQFKLANEKEKLKKLQDERAAKEKEFEGEREAYQKKLAALETQAQTLEKKRLANEKLIDTAESKGREIVGLATNAQKELEGKLAQEIELRKQNKTAETDRDASMKEVIRITDDLNSAVSERIRLEKMNRELADQLAKARECLHYFNVSENSNYKDKEPPAELQGEITGASRPDVIEVSIGGDDGLRKGHKLEIVRTAGGATNYVGRVEVVETYPDRAVCRTDPKMLRSPVQKGDRVYANLSRAK